MYLLHEICLRIFVIFCKQDVCERSCLSVGSGAVALAHFDGSEMDEAVCTMIQRVQELALGYPDGRIELQLVGGFTDAHNYSEELFYNIMSKYAYVVACKQTFNCPQ